MSESITQKPYFSLEAAKAILATSFDQSGALNPLPSERDQNFLVENASGDSFVLRISNADTPPESIELQTAFARRLATTLGEDRFPLPRHPASPDLEWVSTEASGRRHRLRLTRYIPGVVWADYQPITEAHERQLGRLLGEITLALAGFDHPGAHRPLQWDLLACDRTISEGLAYLPESDLRHRISGRLEAYQKDGQRRHRELRRSVIHGDANDHNLILTAPADWRRPEMTLIDFGDVVFSATINELAVALAYALFDVPDPIARACRIVSAYHSIFPLTEEELDLLPELIALRACTSVVQAARNQAEAGADPYLNVSAGPATRLIASLDGLPPHRLRGSLRRACGFSVHPQQAEILDELNTAPNRQPIVEGMEAPKQLAPIDLSVGSPLAIMTTTREAIDQAARGIAAHLRESGASIGIGRWGEPRLCYHANQFLSEEGQNRTVHLGVDLFLEPGLPVNAPLPGRIHSLKDNAQPQDYGPTVILEHRLPRSGQTIFTLYGHLSRESLSRLQVGETIQAGERIGVVGSPMENGGWPPHLHLQLILEPPGDSGNFPGVANPTHQGYWLDLCPNPAAILGIPDSLTRFPSPSSPRLEARRAQSIGPSLSLSYERPLHLVQGRAQFLYDPSGRAYLDGVNNVCHVGHSHPHVVRQIASQARQLNTNTRYLHDKLMDYAEALLARVPAPLEVCFFVCSGSEANDLALRIARTATRSQQTIVLEGGYHGNLTSTIEVSHYKFAGPGGFQPPTHVHVADCPDPFRGRHRSPHAQLPRDYLNSIDGLIDSIQSHGLQVGPFLAESVLSCAGQIVLPEGYLQGCYQAVRQAGGVCIADEVQVGFGRVGSHFWGFETQGVVPDILTLGKPIGNGHPIGAVITTRELARAFHNGMEYFNTYGGNPVSCAAGLAVLEVIESENLQAHAHRVGNQLKAQLTHLQERFPVIGDVRGLGLFLGLEFIEDHETRTPRADIASYVVERMKDARILLSTDGPEHNVIKIKPPLPFDSRDAGRLVSNLERILGEYPAQLPRPPQSSPTPC